MVILSNRSKLRALMKLHTLPPPSEGNFAPRRTGKQLTIAFNK